jgi:hypothetical protein
LYLDQGRIYADYLRKEFLYTASMQIRF